MGRLTVRVKRVRGSMDEDIPLPRYMSEHASGMDIYAAPEVDTVVQPGARCLIPTGIAISLPRGYEAQIRPRSGLALQYGVTLLNSPGTIDADYRGEICIIVINHGDKPLIVRRGDRIAQMVINRVFRVELVEDEDMTSTDRGAGGFGHTGTR